jgi:hypothetical protein
MGVDEIHLGKKQKFITVAATRTEFVAFRKAA